MLPALLLAAGVALSPEVERVLARWPADSLLGPLRRVETEAGHGAPAAEAAMWLGHLHVARGEYRLAAEAYARAAARFDPVRKDEALYWAGIAWLGAPDPRRARALFEQVERDASPRRPEATLGIALAWLAEQHPERALKVLTRLTAKDAGETGPGALQALATAAERAGRPEVARAARERLRRQYPASLEAAGVGPDGEAGGVPGREPGRP
ncbi:MAG TPA: tetratricopeptide repeat protein [Candidatus Eisenbacteria bacterium]